MKVKRYVADDMRTALAQVRDELGSEAVILSNRMIDGGVEILASNDYDTGVAQARQEPAAPRYRSYADIPDEPVAAAGVAENRANAFDQVLEEERVSFSAQPAQTESGRGTISGGMAKANEIAAKLKQRIGGSKSAAPVFDQRQSPEQPVAEASSPSDSSLADTLGPQADQRSAANRGQQPDYVRYLEGAADSSVAASEAEQKAKAETEAMRAELKSLRNLLESQMNLMNWEKQKSQHPVQAGLLKRLAELGLTADISRQVLASVKDITDVETASKRAIAALVKAVPVASDDILRQSGIVALVGPTGVGKTTTIAKLAARHVISHGCDDIALVTLDNYRVGAQEQLYNYARILSVPVHTARNSDELYKVLQNLYDKNLVLIDTAGMSQKDMRICEQFNTLKQGASEVRSYLVLSANAQTSALDEIIRAFKQTEISGCILTKLDEAASLGGVLSMLVRHQLPVSYTSNGQCVPEDLQTAHARELVAQALDLLKQHPEEVSEQGLAQVFNEGLLHAH